MDRIFLLFPILMALGCGAPPSPAPPNEQEPVCADAKVEGITVASTDIYGFPYALGYGPHALDRCSLVFVTAEGDLVARDLETGADVTLASAAEKPRRPAIAGGTLAWEATEAGRSVVRVSVNLGPPTTLSGAFDHAGEPRVAADAVVFTGWLSADPLGDTDIFISLLPATDASPVLAEPGQQRFPDISTTHIAFSDFSEDPDGRFDENATDVSDVVVVERATKKATRRERPGKQAFPLLGAEGRVAFLAWGPEHPEPKFSAYTLLVGDINGSEESAVAAIQTLAPYVRPTARGAFLEWIEWSGGAPPKLLRRPADLSKDAVEVPEITGAELYAPVSSNSLTAVATRLPDGSMILASSPRP